MQQVEFDAYRKWLGISPKDQPPNHYRLLSLELFEDDPDAISNAADRQMAHLRTFQTGPHSALSQQLLNECSAARVCLLNKEEKAKYDTVLRKQAIIGQAAAQATVAATTPPAPVPLPVARQSAPPVPVAVQVRVDSPVKSSARSKRSTPGPFVISMAGILSVILSLFVFWRSQQNQSTVPSTRKATAGVAVAKVKKNVAPVSEPPSVERHADEIPAAESPAAESPSDASAISNDQEPMNQEDRVPLPIEIDQTPDQMQMEPLTEEEKTEVAAPTDQPADEEGAPTDKPADQETTTAMPSDEPESTSAGKKSPAKPKRASSEKKQAKSRRPRLVPKDAILSNGHWYWFSEKKATPEEAQLHAFKLNGRLVTINSADENAFVVGNVKGPTLIGMLKIKGVWMNSAGFAQGYFNWDQDNGQPSSTQNEIYAAIHPAGVWHDYLRDTLYYCIEWGKEP